MLSNKTEAGRLLDIIDDWRIAICEEYHDIEECRIRPRAKSGWDEPPHLFNRASRIVSALSAHFHDLDPKPIMRMHRAVTTWYAERSAKHQPDQVELQGILESAIFVLHAMRDEILTRMQSGEWEKGSANGTDSKTDNFRKSIPENPDVRRLARLIKRRASGETQKDVALDFTEGNTTKAKSLLRQLRRFPDLLK